MPKDCTAVGTIAAGDAVCFVAFDDLLYPTRPMLVTRATSANIVVSRSVFGVAHSGGDDGDLIDVYVAGDGLESAITGLGAGSSRLVVTIKRGTAPPVAGVWVMGDRILNTDPLANGFAGWVCTEGGGVGTWEPYGALESSRAELSLAANFTTDSSGATSTNLSFEVRAGETWLLEFEGLAECSSTGGVKYAIAAPAFTTVAGWLDGTDSSLNDRVVEAIAAANTLTANPIHRVAATPGPDRIVATIVAGDDGVVALQAASGVNMELTTIFAGATLRASRAATV